MTPALIVGNQLTQRGSRERLRTETSKVALKGAEVREHNGYKLTLAKVLVRRALMKLSAV